MRQSADQGVEVVDSRLVKLVQIVEEVGVSFELVTGRDRPRAERFAGALGLTQGWLYFEHGAFRLDLETRRVEQLIPEYLLLPIRAFMEWVKCSNIRGWKYVTDKETMFNPMMFPDEMTLSRTAERFREQITQEGWPLDVQIFPGVGLDVGPKAWDKVNIVSHLGLNGDERVLYFGDSSGDKGLLADPQVIPGAPGNADPEVINLVAGRGGFISECWFGEGVISIILDLARSGVLVNGAQILERYWADVRDTRERRFALGHPLAASAV